MTGETIAIVEKLTKRFTPEGPSALDAIGFSIKSGQLTGEQAGRWCSRPRGVPARA